MCILILEVEKGFTNYYSKSTVIKKNMNKLDF